MAAAKGTRPPAAGKGRTRGVPNKITSDVKEMILEAFHGAGGVKYLIEQASMNPVAFMSLLGRIVPTQINATIKREVSELTRDELLGLLVSARDAAKDGRGDEPPQVH